MNPNVAAVLSSEPSESLRRSQAPGKTTRFRVRPARESDLDALVDIDLRAFSRVYRWHQGDEETRRSQMARMIRKRLAMVGGEWMPVVTAQDRRGEPQVIGFMTCCPTKKTPQDFTSWEETTNHGLLDTLFDPSGKNVYVVTLSMDPRYEGQEGRDAMFLRQIGTFLREGMHCAFFESRMPGLRSWMSRRCQSQDRHLSLLTEAERDALATQYFGLKRRVQGRLVPYDPLLRVYAGVGCELVKVLPRAYQDEPSMNYGVLCQIRNPMADWLRKWDGARIVVGHTVRWMSRSPWLTRRLFDQNGSG